MPLQQNLEAAHWTALFLFLPVPHALSDYCDSFTITVFTFRLQGDDFEIFVDRN